ncbi:hypothetical protein HPB47_003867 [Ixodes persulcatus]|uniref:Uncharacterized protein n=1 Tax=Ixodes persulcatus TaxID=34615 RepID=A0AC60PI99_IXOPE|nr:hypothetical protein HPB47_003867 [Ixodes persulcatus]
MAMQVTVEEEDIFPEEVQCAGWQSAFTKRKSSQKFLPAESEQPATRQVAIARAAPALPPT